MFDVLKERLRELREGLEELKRAETDGGRPSGTASRHEVPAAARPGVVQRPAIRAGESPPPIRIDLDLDPYRDGARQSHRGRPGASSQVSDARPLRVRLRDPGRLREAFVLREILDRPIGLRRRPARRSFRDR